MPKIPPLSLQCWQLPKLLPLLAQPKPFQLSAHKQFALADLVKALQQSLPLTEWRRWTSLLPKMLVPLQPRTRQHPYAERARMPMLHTRLLQPASLNTADEPFFQQRQASKPSLRRKRPNPLHVPKGRGLPCELHEAGVNRHPWMTTWHEKLLAINRLVPRLTQQPNHPLKKSRRKVLKLSHLRVVARPV